MAIESSSLFQVLAGCDLVPLKAFRILNQEGACVFSSKCGSYPTKNVHREVLNAMHRQYVFVVHARDAKRTRALTEILSALIAPQKQIRLLYAADAYRSFLRFVRHELSADAGGCEESVLLGRCLLPSGDAYFSVLLIGMIIFVRSGAGIRSVSCVREDGCVLAELTADTRKSGMHLTDEAFLFEMMQEIAEARGFLLTVLEEEGSTRILLRAPYIPDHDTVLHASLCADAATDLSEIFPFCLFSDFIT